MGRIVATAVAALGLLATGPALAQKVVTQQAPGQPQVQFYYGGITQQPWYSNQAVRQQLKINDDQFNRLNKAWGQYWTHYNTEMGRINDVPENQRYPKMSQYYQTFNKDFNTAANEVLTP